MPALRPRIGIEQIETREARVGQPVEHVRGIAVVQPDVGEPALVDGGKRFRHPVDKRLYADEAGARIEFRLRNEVFTTAKAALPADLVDAVEQRGEVGG